MALETYSVGLSAEAARLPRGTLACWRTRGRVPQKPFELPDVMSLSLAADLCRMGLTVEAATAIAWGVRDGWEDVLLASPVRVFLLTRMGEDGRWIFTTCRQKDIPTPTRDATLQVDLHAIASRAFKQIVEHRS